MAEKVIVDANPIISALLGSSARQVLFALRFLFFICTDFRRSVRLEECKT